MLIRLGSNSLPVDSKLNRNDELFAVAMARGKVSEFHLHEHSDVHEKNILFALTAFDSVPGNVPVAMTVVNPTTNTEVR